MTSYDAARGQVKSAAMATAPNGRPTSAGAVGRPQDLYTGRDRSVFLLVLFLVGTSNYVDRNIIGVLLEPIKEEFGVSDAMLGLLSGLSFALFYATLGLPIARWADRGDRKLIITLSLGVWSVMTALCGVAQNFWQLALARVGVGVGEAGAIPPSQSLIADYYAPERRGWAMGVFQMSSMAGYILGVVLGGWIAHNYGWRAAFIVVGLPGLALALLTHFVLKEPRHQPQFTVLPKDYETLAVSIRALFDKPAYRNIVVAMALNFFVVYGALVFTISLIARVHHLNVAQAGAWMGGVSALGAIIGNLGGGAIADRLAARDVAWFARLSGWWLLAALPFYWLAFLASTVSMLAGFLLIGTILVMGVMPAMFSALHIVCGSRRRAVAVAVAFFFANLIGFGLGPLVTGLVSDALAPSFGTADGLRYALLVVVLVFVPSGYFMLRAVRHMAADAEA